MTSGSTYDRVAVLGLGRMGTAIAERLGEQGWTVTGWTRSGRSAPGPTAPDPLPAVRGATLVVLALFDGEACEQVVEQAAAGLSASVTVVNTSTVAPPEAAALEKAVRANGAGYVHAPVLGSVPTVRRGALTVLAGGPGPDFARARDLLEALGEVLVVGDAATAAALKLVANGALGSALLGVRDGRRHAADLGVDPGLALDVLARGPLARLVQGKRDRLEAGAGDRTPADFTVAALAKDLALLASGSPAARTLSGQVDRAIASGAVAADADIASLASPGTAGRTGAPAVGEAHGLSVAPDVVVPDEVLAPLTSYVAGHATGDPGHFRQAFLPTAHVEGLRHGELVSWSLDDYCALFAGRPAPDEAARRRRLDRVDVEGSVGTATMTLDHGADTFTDVFLLVRVDGGWRIANKAYHRADRADRARQI